MNCSSLFRFDYSHLALICKKFVLSKIIAHITEKILRIQIVDLNIKKQKSEIKGQHHDNHKNSKFDQMNWLQ